MALFVGLVRYSDDDDDVYTYSHSMYRTLGVANVGGMCRPDRSCSLNEDNGITLAHTITHELGHK